MASGETQSERWIAASNAREAYLETHACSSEAEQAEYMRLSKKAFEAGEIVHSYRTNDGDVLIWADGSMTVRRRNGENEPYATNDWAQRLTGIQAGDVVTVRKPRIPIVLKITHREGDTLYGRMHVGGKRTYKLSSTDVVCLFGHPHPHPPCPA